MKIFIWKMSVIGCFTNNYMEMKGGPACRQTGGEMIMAKSTGSIKAEKMY